MIVIGIVATGDILSTLISSVATIPDLILQNPEPPKPWIGIKDCVDDFHPCIQRDSLNGGKLVGSEDCLYLNIYTKSVSILNKINKR